MARADLLLALVRAGASGDTVGFRRASEALIADEQAKRHSVLAAQLRAALSTEHRKQSAPPSVASRTETNLLREVPPERLLSDMVLPSRALGEINDLIEEHYRRELLHSYGVEPRHRVMLVGPPGGGKTSLAEAIASELGVEFLVVRYESLIGSYLGETASRLDALFERARTYPCVLFFDEFDAIAKERGDTHETGEIKRVVSSLLQQIDQLPSHVLVVAATNHPELLDRAVWRRMQLRLELPTPTRALRSEWFEKWMIRSNVDLGLTPRTLADKTTGLSLADIEQIAIHARRKSILNGTTTNMRTTTLDAIRSFEEQVAGVTNE